MRKSVYLVLGMLLFLLAACSNEFNVFQTVGVQWTSFQWVAAEIGGRMEEKAAIMLPVRIDGQEDGSLFMQLDTGCWATQFYERPFQLLDKRAYQVMRAADGRPAVVRYDGAIGSLPIKRGLAEVRPDYGTPHDSLRGDAVLGTIGLDLFSQRVLVLDFPNQRLSVLNAVSELPAEIAASASFVPAGLTQGWFSVEASAPANHSLRLFFDTGSSSSSLVVSSAVWRQLTNKVGDESDVQRLLASSWGEQPEVLGAPLQGEFRLGALQAEGVSVYQIAAFDQFFAQAGVDGLLGNALFYDDYVVILDLKEMRFGLAKLN